MLKRFWNRLPSFLKNKYALTMIGFVVWIAFFDQNNFITQWEYRGQLRKLEKDKAFYEEEISKIQADLEDLRTNPKTLEKFAREKYLMKRDNEEIFVLVKEDE